MKIKRWLFLIIMVVVVFGIYAVLRRTPEDTARPSDTTPITQPLEPMRTLRSFAAPVAPTLLRLNGSSRVTLRTNYGAIVFETYDTDAPLAVENFLNLARAGFYDGTIFHRVISGFMIQGGDPEGTGRGGPPYTFVDELNPATGSYRNGYRRGVVAMANRGPNTNGSQFFIMLADYPLPNNYTIFGRVVEGQEIVDAIGNLSTGANDRPLQTVIMEQVTVTQEP